MKIVPDVDSNLRVVLIGGTSHVGKSTLSESLAARLGWDRVSTDTLARHPGQPWKPAPEKVPDHVAEHYLSLSVDELLEDVLHHYGINVWPKVEAIVASHSNEVHRGWASPGRVRSVSRVRDRPELRQSRRVMAHSQ